MLNHHIGPHARGLEIGSGETTIAPINRTLLSDAYQDHAGATSLAQVFFPAERIPYPDGTFDFLVNEHVLEHLPDPITALKEWMRVMKPGGILFITLPHPERTFDRNRTPTPLSHLIEDHQNRSDSSEDYHWEDWKKNVIDTGLAPHYAPFGKEESLRNNLIHRHVFTLESFSELLDHLGFTVLESTDLVSDRNDSFGVVAKK